jgi:AcrR family transcriptional regulator
MVRKVKEQEYAEKRNEILNAALRLVYTRGYERMTIQDILAELHISSGAFYHYFESKPAVLEAVIERIQGDVYAQLTPIVCDPQLPALEKLHAFFATLNTLRLEHKSTVIQMLRAWYTDENAIVRQKVDAATFQRRAPLMNEIVRQGIQEGIFATPHPDQAGELLLVLLAGMSDTHASLMLSLNKDSDAARCTEGIVNTHAAYMTAIERVLGAPPNCLFRVDAAAVQVWVTALQCEFD